MNVDNIDSDPKDGPLNAVSLYGQDGGVEDFPVLKAFQCYIDAEQEKARKRMLSLCIFFGCLMTIVISVFVVMLLTISDRNQKLNDRLVEFAMNRERAAANGSPVVVQPPQDSAAILALTSKLDSLQKKLIEDQAKAEKASAEAAAKAEKAIAEAKAKAEQAAIEAARPKEPTAEQLEIKKLKAQLSEQKELQAAERERLRQAELEAYRRKHYPELYETPRVTKKRTTRPREEYDEDDDLGDIDEDNAIEYFDDDEEETRPPARKSSKSRRPVREHEAEKEYSIPVDRKSSTGISWSIPED